MILALLYPVAVLTWAYAIATSQTAWSPEQWGTILVLVIGTLGGVIVQVINAIRQNNRINAVHNEMKPPSNGRTLGALVEGQAVKGSMVAQDYVERVRAAGAGEAPPPTPSIPTSLTPTLDDPTLVKRVEAGILEDRRGVPTPPPTPPPVPDPPS